MLESLLDTQLSPHVCLMRICTLRRLRMLFLFIRTILDTLFYTTRWEAHSDTAMTVELAMHLC